MSSSPLGSVQGLSSNIQWQDLVDQMIQLDTQRELTPLKDKVTAETNAKTAWTNFGTVMGMLQGAVKPLSSGTAFGSLNASVSSSPTSGATLLSAKASSGATAGTYGVQVISLASAQQLSGNIVADASAAQSVSGQFIVGGQVVTLNASDSLNDIRDKINALNTGTSATKVSASVLITGGANARLVLSSDVGGAAGIDLRDVRANGGAPSVLSQLGLASGSVPNVGADGITRGAIFGGSAVKIGAMLVGASTLPATSTIQVNGRAVSIDLQNDSLNDVVSKINAQSPSTASIETVTNGSSTSYRLNVSGAVAATADAGSQPVLDLLGLTRAATAVVNQQVSTSNMLQAADGSTATATTALLGLKIAGQNGAQSGDTFTIRGTKADGFTPVSFTATVNGTNTIDDLLTQLSSQFSATNRHVTASIVGGKIQLTDDAGGDSGLSFSIAANNESGVADPVNGAGLSFGATSATVVGRQRQVTAGQDARIVVNGVTLTRSSNSIADAITGVTLDLAKAEVGTTVQVNVSRDASSVVSAVQNFVSAYNSAKQFVDSSTASGGALAFNSSVRSALNIVKNSLLSNVPGLPSGSKYSNVALVGITFDKTGVLQVDSTALGAALSSNPSDVQALFATTGATTGANVSYATASTKTLPGSYDVSITQAATRPTVASTVANFVYAAGGSTDSLTIADSSSGKSGQISLITGDTPDSVAAKLNTLFAAQRMRLMAASSSGTLSITGLDYGSQPSFTVSYASSGGTDPAAMIGIGNSATPTTTQNGLDVQGTFNSGGTVYAATGAGQALTGNSGTAVDGLAILYTGSANSSTGHVDFAQGLAGAIANLTDSVAHVGDGLAAVQASSIDTQITDLNSRADAIQQRLDDRKASLLKQFTAMESALQAIQAQGSQLTNALNSLNSLQAPAK